MKKILLFHQNHGLTPLENMQKKRVSKCEGQFQVQAPRGAYIRRGDLTEGFLRYDFGGLIFGGAYTWRGLFSEFYGSWTVFVYTVNNTFPLIIDNF